VPLNQNSLKQFFVILLSSLLLLPSFGNIIIYANFKINQDEIAKTICIQRKVANNTCNGQCELRKTLKKYDENERKTDNVLKEKVELIYIKPVFENELVISFDTNSSKLSVFHTSEKPISISKLAFRPPTYFI
jgi:hypothetical protein